MSREKWVARGGKIQMPLVVTEEGHAEQLRTATLGIILAHVTQKVLHAA